MTQNTNPSVTERYGPDPASVLAENIASVRERIAAACQQSGTDTSAVRLLPISKTVPAEALRIAHGLGMNELGENKVQEAKNKSEALSDLPIRWVIVGHLQSNKAKYVARFASEFQALDNPRVADALNKRLAAEQREMDVFVQVNTSDEDTKFGLQVDEVHPFLDTLEQYPQLRPKGFMTLALFSDDKDRVRRCFVKLRELRDKLSNQTPAGAMSELSMGMSGDYELAIAEGSTVVRVGQSIFGARKTPDSHYWPEKSK
ncbi:MAG: YggS family pyridoxal phosphate-dependent enzyme [Chthoniobacterales bacterium]